MSNWREKYAQDVAAGRALNDQFVDTGYDNWAQPGGLEDVVGYTDAVNCVHGDKSSCAFTAVAILPVGKFARLGVEGAEAADIASRTADDAARAVVDVAAMMGNADDIVVLGRLEDTAVAGSWPGHVVLNTPNWSLEVNDDFIAETVAQRRTVYLGGPVKGNLVQTSGDFVGQPTIYARELQQLADAGYARSGDYLVPPS